MDTHSPRVSNVSKEFTSDADWQRIWFSTQQRSWRSLAIIPSDSGVEVDRVAEALVATGQMHGEKQVTLLSARGVQFTNVKRLIDALEEMTSRGECVVVPVDPISENPSAIPVLQATSAGLLVVRLGESHLSSARNIIEIAGRERLLGSIVLGA